MGGVSHRGVRPDRGGRRQDLGRQPGRLLAEQRNLIVAAITLVLGTGDFTLKFGGFALGGIGTATFGAILLYALLNRGGEPGVARGCPRQKAA